MDLQDSGSLQALENLMQEFLDPSTSSVRKYEINVQLNNYKCSPQLQKLCFYFITHTSNEYVTMYALSALESVINQHWSSTDWSYREEVRSVVENYLIERGNGAHYLRGKYAKLLVDIAKQDWPCRYPNFFTNILELLKCESNQLIGLMLLRTTSEEFMGYTASFENGRKDEITRLLHTYIPAVFELLTSILENLGTKPRHTATATPPPSPTHPSSAPSLTQQLATATFRPDDNALKTEALQTVGHLFTWVPLNQIPPRIIRAIFNFTNVSTYAQDDDDVSVLALSAVTYLLYRKCTPPGSQEFFIQLYHHVIELLREIVNSSVFRIDNLDPVFVQKLSELLVLLIEHHLWPLELERSFSALEFLSLLFQLTMQLPMIRCCMSCLDVWSAFIKQIKPENAHKYSEVFHGLSSALLEKIRYTDNYSQIKEIHKTDLDDYSDRDWQTFLRNSIEIIAAVAEYAPLETFNKVLIPWKISHDVYRHMENAVDRQTSTLNYEISETERLCCVLKDFTSLTQTLARLSSLFIDQDPVDTSDRGSLLINNAIEELIESASEAVSIRFYNLKVGDSRLTECFIDVHSEILAALKTWLLWMSQNNKLSNHNLKIITDVTLPILHDGQRTPWKISHAAAHLLLALSNLVFAPNMVVIPMVVQFIHVAPSLRFQNVISEEFSDVETGDIVNGAICNLLLKSWGELSQQDNAQRSFLVGVFFDNLTRGFRELTPNSGEGKVNEVVKCVLPSVSHILGYCSGFPTAAKKLLYTALKSTIEHALMLLPSYYAYPEASDHILELFLNVLRVLQLQLGVEGTKHAVQVFLQVAVKRSPNSIAGVDKLLHILQLVVESPGSAYKVFLPGILQLCMENIYPLIVSHATEDPDVFITLLTLLHSILLHRWQYFYISQVRLGYSPGCSETEAGPDTPQQPEQLLAVLRVFGQALLQNDINIFRRSLNALEDLNAKWKLYHKVLFREHLLSNFLSVLMQCLIDKTQGLLSDDIQVAVYNMAAVNFDGFFTSFFHHFILSQNLEGVSPQQWEIMLRNFVNNHDRDMPTFLQHLQHFVNEVQRFRLCNMTTCVSVS